MKVIAAAGLKVPTEANPRLYITESEPVEIEPTSYYLRRIADRELIEAVEPEPPADTAQEPPMGNAVAAKKAARSTQATGNEAAN